MFKVYTIEHFDRELKKLLKKYPSLAADLREMGKSLAENPFQGKQLGKDCYKVRMAISSKGQGKSGGARVIICVKISAEAVTLLPIYDKSAQSDIPDKLLIQLLKDSGLL